MSDDLPAGFSVVSGDDLPAGFSVVQKTKPKSARVPKAPQGVMEQVKAKLRPLGLAGRAAVSGVAGIGDLPAAVYNTMSDVGYGGRFGHIPMVFGDMGARAANALGLPSPQTQQEQLGSATVAGAASAAPFIAMGGPVLPQLLGGAGSGAASEYTRQQGGGVLSQLAAGLVGGVGAGLGAASISRPAAAAARAVGVDIPVAVAAPSTAERLAATRLRQSMSDPARAEARLAEYGSSVVPGVRPTLAEATGDQGIIGLSRSQRNTARNGAALTQAMGDNTLARTSFIDNTFGAGSVDALNEAAATALENRNSQVSGAVGRVGDVVPPEVAGMQARDKLVEAADVSKRAARRLYEDLPGGDEPLRLSPVDLTDNLPQPVANPERAAFEQAAREGLKAGDTSNKATGGLASFIVSRGGIQPNRVEQGFTEMLPGVSDLYSAGINPKSRPGLFSKNGGTLDNLLTAAQDAGFFPKNDPKSPNKLTVDDLVQALTDDVNGRPVYRQDDLRGLDRAQANAEADYWGRMFQNADTSPEKMTQQDWDNLYRDVQELPPHTMTQADAEAMGGAGVGNAIGPAQSAVLETRKRIMGVEPMGNGPVDSLVRKFVNADVLETRDVEDIARRLHEQAGYTYGTREGAYATAAANAVDGFLRSAAPPERLDALRQAQAAWKDYSTTFNRAGTPIATALRKDFGDFRQPDSTVGATLVPSGRKGAEFAGRLEKAIGPDAETLARTELRSAIDAAGERGADIRKVRAKYADTLRAYPALKSDIDAAVETAAISDAFRASPMGKLADPSANASKIIGSVIQNGDTRGFKQIAAYARTPEAKAGLRRSMANYIAKMGERGGGVAGTESEAGMTELQHIGNTIKALDNVLTMQSGSGVLEPAQVASLKAVRGELSRANTATRLNPPVGSNTSRDVKGLADLANNAAIEAASTHIPGASVASTIMKLMRSVNMGKAEDILVQALIDPEVAKRLLARSTESNVRGALSMIAARQSALAAVPRSMVPANDFGAGMAAAAASTDQTAKDK